MSHLCIIVPVYNEADNIEYFLDKTEPYCQQIGKEYSFIFINDGSSDDTKEVLDRLVEQKSNITAIHFSRNFGKEAALSAGINYSNSQVIIPMDVDMQDPPELIVDMYAEYEKGFDVVLAVRKSRNTDSFIKRTTAKWFYAFLQKVGEVEIIPNAGDFRLIDKKVVKIIKQMPEKTRFMKGILTWPGFKMSKVYYERPERSQGDSKWKFWGLWNLALDGIFSFSSVALKLWFYVGTFISFMALFYMLFSFMKVLIFGIDVPGYASLLSVVLFLGGVQLISLGLIGEYIARIFIEVKQRPLYVVDEVAGLNKDELEAENY